MPNISDEAILAKPDVQFCSQGQEQLIAAPLNMTSNMLGVLPTGAGIVLLWL